MSEDTDTRMIRGQVEGIGKKVSARKINVKYPARKSGSETKPETIKDRTRNLLIRYPTARENNLYAVCAYLRTHLGVRVSELTDEQLNNDGVLETVLRSIREIQHEEGVLLPNSPMVRHKRRITDAAWKRWRRKRR